MSLAEILAPAISLAREGYAIAPRVAHDIANQRDLLRRDPTAGRTFLDGNEVPKVGSIQKQPELAQTLEAISREGPDAFYRGPVAEDMVSYLRPKANTSRRSRRSFAGGPSTNVRRTAKGSSL
jgi:gamma-glutamyltranspeptidase/glutathione hydrolase